MKNLVGISPPEQEQKEKQCLKVRFHKNTVYAPDLPSTSSALPWLRRSTPPEAEARIADLTECINCIRECNNFNDTPCV
jgi:hypothetical protein